MREEIVPGMVQTGPVGADGKIPVELELDDDLVEEITAIARERGITPEAYIEEIIAAVVEHEIAKAKAEAAESADSSGSNALGAADAGCE